VNKAKGFTLIELMITIAILSTIAYPSYLDSVRKSRRAVAQADLVELASFMERFFSENNQYHQTYATTPVAIVLPANISSVHYAYSLPVKTSTTYTLRAMPNTNGGQNTDSCGTLTLTHLGLKAAATENCW